MKIPSQSFAKSVFLQMSHFISLSVCRLDPVDRFLQRDEVTTDAFSMLATIHHKYMIDVTTFLTQTFRVFETIYLKLIPSTDQNLL